MKNTSVLWMLAMLAFFQQAWAYQPTQIDSLSPCDSLQAGFAFSTSGLTVQFTNTSSSGVDDYAWSFGDGGSSFQADPSYTYASAGSYTVCLAVSDTVDSSTVCTDTLCLVVTVQDSLNPCDSTQAGFSFTTSHLFACFTNTSQSSGSAAYTWDFGDGNTSTATDPSHFYASGGTYPVCLTVSDTINDSTICLNQWCDTLTVADSCEGYVADFEYSISGGKVVFGILGEADVVYWNFGDGKSDVTSSPVIIHNYKIPGIYEVCLTMVKYIASPCPGGGVDSCVAEVCKVISIESTRRRVARMESPTLEASIQLSPQPADSWVQIQAGEGEVLSGFLTIHNMQGQRVYQAQLQDESVRKIDISRLTSGMYIVSLRQGDQVWTEKLLKN